MKGGYVEAQQYIAIYVASLRGGGAERVMVMLANEFAARGYKVDLVLVQAVGPYRTEVADNVRIVDLGARRTIFALPALVRYLRRARPAVMLSAMYHVNVVALLAVRLSLLEIPLVISVRNTLTTRLETQGMQQPLLLMWMIRWLYPRARALIAVSEGVAADISKVLGKQGSPIHVIYNPVDQREIKEKKDDDTAPQWLLDLRPPLLFSAGRFARQKDFPTLIRAFGLLRQQRDARLILLGEGPEQAVMEQLIADLDLSDSLFVAGFQKNPFVWIKHASVFVLASRWEGFGNVLTEAASLGVRIVSTDCPSGPAEILEDGKWGRLVPPGDPQALADAMGAALDDPETPDYTEMLKRFDKDRIVNQYLDVLLPDRDKAQDMKTKG